MRAQIEINDQYLDLYEDVALSLNYTIGDIREPDKRQSNYSKTIVIPGTGSNNKIFTHIFEVGKKMNGASVATQFNPDFNPNLKADAKLYIDGNLVMQGYMQLLRITKLQGKIDYEVTIYGNLGNLFQDIKDLDLNQIDLSEYDHEYNIVNIHNSWATSIYKNGSPQAFAYGEGYVYPYIDYCNTANGAIATIDDMPTSAWQPAIYVKTIIDKIFSEAGYSYVSSFFNSSFFKKLIVPYTGEAPKLSQAEVDSRKFKAAGCELNIGNKILCYTSDAYDSGEFKLTQLDYQGGGFDNGLSIYNYSVSDSIHYIAKTGSEKLHAKIKADIYVGLKITAAAATYISKVNTAPAATDIPINMNIRLYRVRGGITTNIGTVGESFLFDWDPSKSHVVTNNAGQEFEYNMNSVTITLSSGTLLVLPGDEYYLTFEIDKTFYFNLYDTLLNDVSDKIDYNFMRFDFSPYASDNYFYNEIINDSLNENDTISLSNYLPDKIKQGEFMQNIFKMFNLYAVPSSTNPKEYTIETRADFYNDSVVDWTDKVDYLKEINVIPLAELDSKVYKLSYKEDTDHYNTAWQRLFKEVHGEAKKVISNDFVKNTNDFGLTISPTPVVGNSLNNRVLPVFSDFIESAFNNAQQIIYTQLKKRKAFNTRILMYNGLKSTDQTWRARDNANTTYYNMTTYPMCAMFDDIAAPTVTLEFTARDFAFFTRTTKTDNTLWNLYWRDYIEAITDPNSKMITCYMKLTPVDIALLDFRKLYLIDNQYYRLNKIYDYDPLSNETTKVELFRTVEGSPFAGETIDTLPQVFSYNYVEGGENEIRDIGATSPENYIEGGLNEVRDLGATSFYNLINGGNNIV